MTTPTDLLRVALLRILLTYPAGRTTEHLVAATKEPEDDVRALLLDLQKVRWVLFDDTDEHWSLSVRGRSMVLDTDTDPAA